MSAYEVRKLEDFEVVPVTGAGIDWRPVRRTLGIRAFGINAYSADEPGRHVVEEHSETQLRHEEVYVEADAGTLVYVRDPETRRAAVALELLHYHVAYYEALNGNRAAALEHLRTSVEHRPETATWARDDEDFASLREDPELLAVTGEPDAGGERA